MGTGGSYEDLFDKPLSEYTYEELLEMGNETRTARKYPAVTKKVAKKDDAMDKLISSYVIKKANKATKK